MAIMIGLKKWLTDRTNRRPIRRHRPHITLILEQLEIRIVPSHLAAITAAGVQFNGLDDTNKWTESPVSGKADTFTYTTRAGGYTLNVPEFNSTNTTLSGDITSNKVSIVVTSTASLPDIANGSYQIVVDNETILVTGVSDRTLTVTRGYGGTPAAVHKSAAKVSLVTGLLLTGNMTIQTSPGTAPEVKSMNMTATSQFTIGGATFVPKSLTVTFNNDKLKIYGTTDVTIGNALPFTLVRSNGVSLGDALEPGLLIGAGHVENITFSVTNDLLLGSYFDIKKVQVGNTQAELELTGTYKPADKEYAFYGKATIDDQVDDPEKKIFDNVEVELGENAEDPGIAIGDGSLKKLDIKVNGDINILGQTFSPKDLHIKYAVNDEGQRSLTITGNFAWKGFWGGLGPSVGRLGLDKDSAVSFGVGIQWDFTLRGWKILGFSFQLNNEINLGFGKLKKTSFEFLRSSGITAASNASPIVITTAADQTLRTGDQVTISGIGGNTAANGTWIITATDATHFSLNNSKGNGSYTPQTGKFFAKAKFIAISDSSPIVITTNDRNLTTGDKVTIEGVKGNTAANGTWTITRIDSKRFSLDGSKSNGIYFSESGGRWSVPLGKSGGNWSISASAEVAFNRLVGPSWEVSFDIEKSSGAGVIGLLQTVKQISVKVSVQKGEVGLVIGSINIYSGEIKFKLGDTYELEGTVKATFGVGLSSLHLGDTLDTDNHKRISFLGNNYTLADGEIVLTVNKKEIKAQGTVNLAEEYLGTVQGTLVVNWSDTTVLVITGQAKFLHKVFGGSDVAEGSVNLRISAAGLDYHGNLLIHLPQSWVYPFGGLTVAQMPVTLQIRWGQPAQSLFKIAGNFLNGVAVGSITIQFNGVISYEAKIELLRIVKRISGTIRSPFTDDFRTSQLKSDWTTRTGSFNKGVGTDTVNVAIVNTASINQADVDVGAGVRLTANQSFGLIARDSGTKRYLGEITRNSANQFQVAIILDEDGKRTTLATSTMAAVDELFGLHFKVSGSSLQLFVNETLKTSINDTKLSAAGQVGMRTSVNVSVNYFSAQ